MRKKGHEFDVAHFGTQFLLGRSPLIKRLRMGSFHNNTLDSIRDMLFQAWPGQRHQLKTLVGRNEAFIKAVLEVTGKRVFVDTSKDRLRLRALQRFSSFDVRAIHLVRDVRGVVASQLRRNTHINAREAAQQWARLHHRLLTTLKSLPAEKRAQVRYEDLCQDVQGTLDRLYTFFGVDPAIRITNFRMTSHHIIGNPMRLESLSEIKLDERWQSMLTEHELAEINLAGGMWSRQFGYR
jgi:hypothetical protein